jgi:hypothetical protein
MYFECAHADYITYQYRYGYVSAVCENDPYGYQVCGLNKNMPMQNKFLCGEVLFCSAVPNKFGEKMTFEYMEQKLRDDCRTHGTHTNDSIPQKSLVCGSERCEDGCDYCNGLRYGVICAQQFQIPVTTVGDSSNLKVPISDICNGFSDCFIDSKDEADCNITNSSLHTCVHYVTRMRVPIFNYTRCGLFIETSHNKHPYCLDYLDQTNCSDVDRVAGRCLVNGFLSNISITIVCHNHKKLANSSATLCDDGMENMCLAPSTITECTVHKHKMCDGVMDCSDGSDEFHDLCDFQTKSIQCRRNFNVDKHMGIPFSWVMDNVGDCIDGEDEIESLWSFC